MEFFVTVNFFDNNDPMEVFVRIAKEGSTIAGFVEALCITVSIAWQYNVPWEVLYHKYLGQIFEPRDDESSSLVDGIGKVINGMIKDVRKGNVQLHTQSGKGRGLSGQR
jgi:hypothetical protein